MMIQNSPHILFIMLNEREVYRETLIKAPNFHLPSLAYAMLGAVAKQNNYLPHIIDLTLSDNPLQTLESSIKKLSPQYIGLSCTTNTFDQACSIAALCKTFDVSIKILIGGAHVSALPLESMQYTCFDYGFIGEAESSFDQFLKNESHANIDGFAYRLSSEEIKINPKRNYISDLDSLPFPDYSLYDLSQYQLSKFFIRSNPCIWIETSRGCPFGCMYCSKAIHGKKYRYKSPERVVKEFEYFVDQGIQEFAIADDGFTQLPNRAEQICDLMIQKQIPCKWCCPNGIRIDRTSSVLIQKMYRAGCYRVAFGIESGSQKALDDIGKGNQIEDVKPAVMLAKKTGMELYGYFLMGFPRETIKELKETIYLAASLPLDVAKVNLIVPYPGSVLYDEYKKMNLFKNQISFNNFNNNISPRQIYNHPVLDWDTLEKYRKRFYLFFYLNPLYLFRRLCFSIKNGLLWEDIKLVITIIFHHNPL